MSISLYFDFLIPILRNFLKKDFTDKMNKYSEYCVWKWNGTMWENDIAEYCCSMSYCSAESRWGLFFIYELPYSAGILTETRDDINSDGAFSQASC